MGLGCDQTGDDGAAVSGHSGGAGVMDRTLRSSYGGFGGGFGSVRRLMTVACGGMIRSLEKGARMPGE